MAIIKNPVTVIQGGGSTPPEPLDPDVVYNNTRPSYWLEMPDDEDVEDETAYYLLDIDINRQDDYVFPFQLTLGSSSSWKYDIEFGSMQNGTFVVDPTYSLTDIQTSSAQILSVPTSMFIPTTSGTSKQLLMRVKTQNAPTWYMLNLTSPTDYRFINAVVEFKIRSDKLREFKFNSNGGNSNVYNNSPSLRYATLLGWSNMYSMDSGFKRCTGLIAVRTDGDSLCIGDYYATEIFAYCSALIATPTLDCSKVSASAGNRSLYGLFSYCSALQVAPKLIDTDGVKNFGNMFYNCYSLEYVPAIGASGATGFNNMFYTCYQLKEVGGITTTNTLTSTKSMFYDCNALEKAPMFDTSSVTDFTEMFRGCLALEEVPAFDTSSATAAKGMFQNCRSLKTIPLLDFSHVAALDNLFYFCYSLNSIPSIDTSSATSMAYMFYCCYSLKTIPALDTSHVKSFAYMFNGCKSISTIPTLDLSVATNLEHMFSDCYALEKIPVLSVPSTVTTVGYMMSSCYSLRNLDMTNWNLSGIVNSSYSSNILNNAMLPAGGEVILPPASKSPASWGAQAFKAFGSNPGTSTFIADSGNIRFIINDSNTMIALAQTGTNIFGANNDTIYRRNYVYVPDSMYATYTANSYWNALGTRLKKLSDLPS